MSERPPYSTGDIYRTTATFELADGTTHSERRGLIIWDCVEHDDRRDPRTHEMELTLLVTWASTNFDTDGPDQPAGDPFEITQLAAGWTLVEEGSVHGQIEQRVGRYKANDPRSNSVEIMAAHCRERLAELATWQATRPERPEPAWNAAVVAKYLGIEPGTWRSYVANGIAPKPTKSGGRNYWEPAVIREWDSRRPGPGARTDLSPSS